MKKIVLLTVLLISITLNCLALDPSFLNKFNGKWYDNSGNLYMEINNGYLNGSKIVDIGTPIGSKSIGSANVRILEKSGYRDIYFEWIATTVNPILRINKKIGLHKQKDPRTFESVGGVYLGMPINEVAKLYGKPDGFDAENPSIIRTAYAKDRWGIGYTFDCVSEIVILNDSNKRFDWSGYNCFNSAEEFKKKYHLEYNRLSTGEYLFCGPTTSDSRQLTLVALTMFDD